MTEATSTETPATGASATPDPAATTAPAAEPAATDHVLAQPGTTGSADGSEAPATETQGTNAATSTPPLSEALSDLAVPDGSPLTEAHLDDVREFAEAQGLTADAARALLERDAGLLAEMREADKEHFVAQGAEWAKEVRAHDTMGGTNYAKTQADYTAALSRFAPPEFAAFLSQSSFGNHPWLVQTLSAVGAAMGESKPVNGDPAPTPSQPGQYDASKLFPKSHEAMASSRMG